MNYRHQFHAGNFADVLKHAALLHILKTLQTKEKGLLYLDTHAGRGGYDLTQAASGTSLARQPEWPDGLGRLWGRADLPPLLAEYLSVVRDFDGRVGAAETAMRMAARSDARERPDGEAASGSLTDSPTTPAVGERGPKYYPGSPCCVADRLREQDRAVFCERQPEEAAALAAEFTGRRKISVQAVDGFGAVRALLPPLERRALVLIDPPYEAQDEWACILTALVEGLTRLPSGTFVVWYPLTARARVDSFYRRLLEMKNLPPCLTVELLIAGDAAARRLWGCGLLVLNPPWKSAVALDGLARWLGPELAQGPGARGGVHWLVPEV
ncbi:MAG: 23S rRNA (adenine(2030)-N(6))-methyltransferase RlmJ [Verrucomicrobia bacterium]|nr:MAG: 23S rRNA (adenine(2030)-N(6))-methyltransferase RlmJ [Verrucomicrobiota bacterium]